jgi:hypothetical protein
MVPNDSQALLVKWLNDKGYSAADIQKILTRLAQHDQQTLTDSIFDSIGSSDKSLDDLLGDLLRE